MKNISIGSFCIIMCLLMNSNSSAQIQSLSAEDGAVLITPRGLNSSEVDPDNLIRNVGLGSDVLNSVTLGEYNTGVGYEVLKYNTSGAGNTALGYQAVYKTNIGLYNVGIGFLALTDNTSGSYNIASGFKSLHDNTIGNNNVAVGRLSSFSNFSGENNIAFGDSSLYTNTTGDDNLAIGKNALRLSRAAKENTAVGRSALENNATTERSTAVGFEAMQNSNGKAYIEERLAYNTALGYQALRGGSNPNANYGQFNTALGDASMSNTTTGSDNTAAGSSSLPINTRGSDNTAIGRRTLLLNTTGSGNTALGIDALISNTTGTDNVCLGKNANVLSGTYTNAIAIGTGAIVDASNKIRMGNTSITHADIQVAWGITSDRRWKENIDKIPLGIDFIYDLKPVEYHRKNNKNADIEFGLIAQDLEKTLNKYGFTHEKVGMLNKSEDGYYTVRYNDLIPVLIKALQEQKEIINSLKVDYVQQREVNAGLSARLEKIEALLLK